MDSDHNDVRLVGRKSNAGLWAVLALIAAVLLGYLFWLSMDESGVAGDQSLTGVPTTTQNQQARWPQNQQNNMADDVRDIGGIYALTSVRGLHNQNVEFSDLVVTRIISDSLFYVHQGNTNQQLLVHLEPDLLEERGVSIDAGQRIRIEGELKDVSQEAIEVGEQYTQTEVNVATGERVLLVASDIEMQ